MYIWPKLISRLVLMMPYFPIVEGIMKLKKFTCPSHKPKVLTQKEVRPLMLSQSCQQGEMIGCSFINLREKQGRKICLLSSVSMMINSNNWRMKLIWKVYEGQHCRMWINLRTLFWNITVLGRCKRSKLTLRWHLQRIISPALTDRSHPPMAEAVMILCEGKNWAWPIDHRWQIVINPLERLWR